MRCQNSNIMNAVLRLWRAGTGATVNLYPWNELKSLVSAHQKDGVTQIVSSRRLEGLALGLALVGISRSSETSNLRLMMPKRRKQLKLTTPSKRATSS